MRKWSGGLTKHPTGWLAYVPREKGRGLRFYNSCKKTALQWQEENGFSIWGEKWPEIKKNGVCRMTERATRSKRTRKSIKIADGVVDRTVYRITKAGSLSTSYQIQVNYMTLTNGEKKQRTKTISYGSKKSGREREEAIKIGLELRNKKVNKYLMDLKEFNG